MHLSSMQTNFSGMLPDIRILSLDEWSDKYFKPVKALLGSVEIREARGIICQWMTQLKTNNEHIYKCFSANFTSAASDGDKPELFLYALTDIKDEPFLKAFHDVRNTSKFIEDTSKILSTRAYKEGLNDNDLLQFDRLPLQRKITAALRMPSAIYVSELNLFLLINTNSYQVLRDQGILGSLKQLALSKIAFDENRRIKNVSNAWLPINASAIQLSDEKSNDGIAFLSVEPAIKASLAVSLIEQIPETAFLSFGQIYINASTMKIIPVEKIPFIPCKTFGDNIETLFSAEKYELENISVKEQEEVSQSPFEAEEIEEVKQENSSDSFNESFGKENAYCLFNIFKHWDSDRIASNATLKTLFIIKRNYEDSFILRAISRDEAVDVLTSRDNINVYDQDCRWSNAFKKLYSTTILWFDPHSISSNPAEAVQEKYDILMKEVLKKNLKLYMLNPLIPAYQLAFLASRILINSIDSVELVHEPSPVLCARLRLLKKPQKRHSIDVSCFLTPDGTKVNVLGFRSGIATEYHVAFDIDERSRHFIKSYSRGTAADFIAHHSAMVAQKVM